MLVSLMSKKKKLNFYQKLSKKLSKRWVLYTLYVYYLLSKRCVSENAPLIISLTSYHKRFDVVYLVIEAIFQQNTDVNFQVVLTIAQQDIDIYGGLPKNIDPLIKRGLQLRVVDENIKSYKKIYYIANENHRKAIITIDDDIYYPNWWLQSMLDAVKDCPDTVLAYRGHYILQNNQSLLDYKSWLEHSDDIYDNTPLFSFLPTGTSGVYYPVGSLNGLYDSKADFLNLCPCADDLWLKFICTENGIKGKRISVENLSFTELKSVDHLGRYNVAEGGNDVQFQNLMSHSTRFVSRILSDSKSLPSQNRYKKSPIA